MDQKDKEIIKQLIDKEIIALITEQKSVMIKAGPGKDKNSHEVVRELHDKISLYLDILSRL